MSDKRKDINNKSKEEQANRKTQWRDLSIFMKILIIFGIIFIAVFVLAPAVILLLEDFIPDFDTESSVLRALEDGFQIVVGVASLVLAIFSIYFANNQDKKITASLNKLGDLERKIDTSNERKSFDTIDVKPNPKNEI